MRKKIGLCLGAGGARGVAHVGVLQALEEEKIKIDYITGCSMGAVVGACYSHGMKPKEMLEVALALKTTDLIDISINPLRNKAILRSTKMWEKLKSLLGETEFTELKLPFKCVSMDLISGKSIVFDSGKVVDAVIASASIPFVFKPYPLNGMLLVDGGLTNRVPIKELRRMGAEKIIAVDVLGPLKKNPKISNFFDLAFRTVDVLDWNNTSKRLSKDKGDILLVPDMGDMSQYKIKQLQFAYDTGYNICKENMEKIKESIK